MNPLPHQASAHEQQLAMAILAHATRSDEYALVLSLDLLATSSAELRPICVIAALLEEFQRGMDSHGYDLASWFASQALTFAAQGTNGGK